MSRFIVIFPTCNFQSFFPHYAFCLDIRSYLFASKKPPNNNNPPSAKSVSASCLRAVIIQRTEKSKNNCFEKKEREECDFISQAPTVKAKC